MVSFKIYVVSTSDTIANILDFTNILTKRRKSFHCCCNTSEKMRQWDQQVFLLVFPYPFQPNISLVLLMASQVYT
jgi:hypothetical protein